MFQISDRPLPHQLMRLHLLMKPMVVPNDILLCKHRWAQPCHFLVFVFLFNYCMPVWHLFDTLLMFPLHPQGLEDVRISIFFSLIWIFFCEDRRYIDYLIQLQLFTTLDTQPGFLGSHANNHTNLYSSERH